MTASVSAPTAESFVTRDVGTGEVVGEFPDMDAAAVAKVIGATRESGRVWARMGFAQRRTCLLAWAADVVAHSDDFVSLIHRETGKPTDDAIPRVNGRAPTTSEVA